MNQRFQPAEIKLVSEKYAENELYKAICQIGRQLEAELTEFGLCPEECIVETLELLNIIANKGDAISTEIEDIWLQKHNEYKRFDRHVSENEIRKAVGIVFGFAILALGTSSHSFYKFTLTQQLMQNIANHSFEEWPLMLDKIFSISLPDGWYDTFINEEPEKDNGCNREESGTKVTKFTDFIINNAETDKVISIIRKNITPSRPKQTALVIIGGIEAGKIQQDVSSPSIEKEFGVKGNSIKPYLTKYRGYKIGLNNYFSEDELKPFKVLYCEK